MSKLILGSLLAAIVMFVFGAVFWMSPISHGVLGTTADDKAAGQALLEHFPATGNYAIPGMNNDEATSTSLAEAGPIAFVSIQREGGKLMDPKYLGIGLLQYFLTMLLAGSVLRKVGSAYPSYGSRVGLVALFGVLVGLLGDLGMPIWWRAPWHFFLLVAVYTAISTTLGGLVLAKFAK